jgi:hypothetical protein
MIERWYADLRTAIQPAMLANANGASRIHTDVSQCPVVRLPQWKASVL